MLKYQHPSFFGISKDILGFCTTSLTKKYLLYRAFPHFFVFLQINN